MAEKHMVAGHLRERRGIYQIILSYTDESGKRHTVSKSTGLPVKGNKRRADAMLQEARKEKEKELERLATQKKGERPSEPSETIFTQFHAGLAGYDAKQCGHYDLQLL